MKYDEFDRIISSPEFQRLVFDKLIVTDRCHLFGDVRAHTISRAADDLVYDIQVAVASKEVALTPSSWWQHFKLDCMPAWFTWMFPVRYDKTSIVVRCDPGHFTNAGSKIEVITQSVNYGHD